jgi:cell filamentation protein, protein adenylyltransferase
VSDDPYVYPGTNVLKNKLGIRDAEELDRAERKFATQRRSEGVPTGNFGLEHLRAIHRHQFQDVYDWAGEIRTVELSKDGQQFQFRRFIETGMADVYNRLAAANFLKGCSRADFAHQAARIIGDVNYVHPFREGNGRTQLFYLEQLAEQAGHPLDLTKLAPKRWIEASQHSHAGDYAAMAWEISQAYERQS